MILSVSRRSDIPAFYSQWFLNRLREGYVLVPNPMNRKQVSGITLSPETIDGIVFWTRNGAPLIPYLGQIKAYPYYFQWTLTAYDADVEPHLPPHEKSFATLTELSEILGAHCIIWRYDPIFLSARYSIDFHVSAFRTLAEKLSGKVEKCVISFYDAYAKVKSAMGAVAGRVLSETEMHIIAENFSEIAQEYNIELATCCEVMDLEQYGIMHNACIDADLLTRISGHSFKKLKDKNQRPACNCVGSVDIGMYDSCLHGCRYCYANRNEWIVRQNNLLHNPQSPLLIGELRGDEKITERKAVSALEI